MTNSAKRHITPAKKLFSDSQPKELSIVIPAAGMGYRMKSHGPKALTKLYGGVTLIENQIKMLLKTYEDADLFVVVGFQADKIRKKLQDYPVRFVYNPLHESTNVLYSIGLGLQACISKSVLIVYGDLIFNETTIKDITKHESQIIVDENNQFKDDEVGVVYNDNFATNFAYGIQHKWAQIAYLTGNELSIFKKTALNADTSQWFGFEGLKDVLNKGGKLKVVRPDNMTILEIDCAKDLEKIQKGR